MCALSHLSEFHLSSPFGFNEGGMLARMYNFNVSLGPITYVISTNLEYVGRIRALPQINKTTDIQEANVVLVGALHDLDEVATQVTDLGTAERSVEVCAFEPPRWKMQ